MKNGFWQRIFVIFDIIKFGYSEKNIRISKVFSHVNKNIKLFVVSFKKVLNRISNPFQGLKTPSTYFNNIPKL